jgi:hypothetical protein
MLDRVCPALLWRRERAEQGLRRRREHTGWQRSILFVGLDGKARLIRQTAGSIWAAPSPDGRKIALLDAIVDSRVWLLRQHAVKRTN